MILTEIGDFARFDSPDKLLSYAGMSSYPMPPRS
ncbi:MAG TPA: transposase [Candidatus Onthomonas avicola]|nr:transposase [Candidatus Onthomonas avicola]